MHPSQERKRHQTRDGSVKPASSTRSELPVVVLDASAGVEIVLGTTGGGFLAGHVANDDELAVPDHFHLECATALRRMGLRGELTLTDAQAATPRSTAVVQQGIGGGSRFIPSLSVLPCHGRRAAADIPR